MLYSKYNENFYLIKSSLKNKMFTRIKDGLEEASGYSLYRGKLDRWNQLYCSVCGNKLKSTSIFY